MQRKMSCLESGTSYLKSLVKFIEEEEIPLSKRGSRRKKSKDIWSPESQVLSASSSLPKPSSRRLSHEFPTPRELAMPSWNLDQSKPTTDPTPISETAPGAAKSLPEQDQTFVSKHALSVNREGREQAPPSNQRERGHAAPFEIQNFKFHDLGLPST